MRTPASLHTSPAARRFNEHQFHNSVNQALVQVRKILSTARHPVRASEVDHTYTDKYALSEFLTNVAIASQLNVLDRLGLAADSLATLQQLASKDAKEVTLRFEGTRTCTFVEERKTTVESPHEHTVAVEEKTKKGFLEQVTKTTSVKHKVTTEVAETVWSVKNAWGIYIYHGSDPTENRIEMQSRLATSEVVTSGCRTKNAPYPASTEIGPLEVSLSWLLCNVSSSTTVEGGDKAVFKIDRDTCKTPRRNEDSETALEFFCNVDAWCKNVILALDNIESVGNRDPSIGSKPESKLSLRSITTKAIFVPVLPLFEDTIKDVNPDEAPPPLLSSDDVDVFLSEQCRSLDSAISALVETHPAPTKTSVLISSLEAKLYVLSLHSKDIVKYYSDGMDFIETMLTNQLEAAIGKIVDRDDFFEYMSSSLGKNLFSDFYLPRPFSFAVRRLDHSPDGAISIERFDNDGKVHPIITAECKIDSEPNAIHMPINASTSVELMGEKYLHGWLNCRFGNNSSQPRYQITARARQFSSFMLVIGKLSGPDIFEPQEAIIISNKDELFLPLLLEELPTAKAFRDAISSLSPEQRRFAEAFRAMQLSSSVFGLLTIQLKPQLETLLGVPPCSLTKEVRLSEDLLSLFIDYQIPSDLLSYDGPTNCEASEKVAAVKKNCQNVLDMIEGLKEKEIKEQAARADMAFETRQAEQPPHSEGLSFGSAGSAPIPAENAISVPMMRAKRCGARSAVIPQEMTLASCLPMATPTFDDTLAFDMCMEDEIPTSIARSTESNFASPPKINSTASESTENNMQNIAQPGASAREGTDFTAIPKKLDKLYEEYDADDALRATTVKVGAHWRKKSQANLLAKMSDHTFDDSDEKSSMRAKAFDLLDALSRSGALPIACSELHVIVCSTYRFERELVETVIQGNTNPIERTEIAFLLMNSTIHNIEPKLLLKDGAQVARLSQMAPKMITAGVADGKDDGNDAEAS
jgi:hypothetical protein